MRKNKSSNNRKNSLSLPDVGECSADTENLEMDCLNNCTDCSSILEIDSRNLRRKGDYVDKHVIKNVMCGMVVRDHMHA